MLTLIVAFLSISKNSLADEWKTLALLDLGKHGEIDLVFRYQSITVEGSEYLRPQFASKFRNKVMPMKPPILDGFADQKQHLLITLSPSQIFGVAAPEFDEVLSEKTITRNTYANRDYAKFQWLGLSWVDELTADTSNLKPDLSIIVSAKGAFRIGSQAATSFLKNATDLFVGNDIDGPLARILPSTRIVQATGATPDSFSHFILTELGEFVEIGYLQRARPGAQTVYLQASFARRKGSPYSAIQVAAFERIKPMGFATPSKAIQSGEIDFNDLSPIASGAYAVPRTLNNVLQAIEAGDLAAIVDQLNSVTQSIVDLSQATDDWQPLFIATGKALELQLMATFASLAPKLDYDQSDFGFLVQALARSDALKGDISTRAARFKNLLDRVGSRILTDATAVGWDSGAGAPATLRLLPPCATLVNAEAEPALVAALLAKLQAKGHSGTL